MKQYIGSIGTYLILINVVVWVKFQIKSNKLFNFICYEKYAFMFTFFPEYSQSSVYLLTIHIETGL